jgi:hypothetical protein
MKIVRLLLGLLGIGFAHLQAQNRDIIGPKGSQQFGSNLIVLNNGNYIVSDPSYSDSIKQYIGAVYLYEGKTHKLISILLGSSPSDAIGSGIVVLPNNNFIVISPYWNNGSAQQAGAVTLCDGQTGLNEVVSSTNSLVGSNTGDLVGSNGIIVLPNGNYLVKSARWGISANTIGAVTWGHAVNGVKGVLSSANSLVGCERTDSIKILSNSNYIVSNSDYSISKGFVAWGDGTKGVTGIVSSTNALIGSNNYDYVGSFGIVELTNGNYVVRSPLWDNGILRDAGAITWGSGVSGVTGTIDSNNSLIGSSAYDVIGMGLTVLSNGNFVAINANWDNGLIRDAGSATWGDGSKGLHGIINSKNSLVSIDSNYRFSLWKVIPLVNGNYVVYNSTWNNGKDEYVGAVTWGDGSKGIVGKIDSSNSLIGGRNYDLTYAEIYALPNGHFVVSFPYWSHDTIKTVGAVTWCNGNGGTVGKINVSNSFIGSHADDMVGLDGITVLDNSNYIVRSSNWDRDTITDAGAITWCDGSKQVVGIVDINNSMYGGTKNDLVGSGWVRKLKGDNYLAFNPHWSNFNKVEVGAITWGNGTIGTFGKVGVANSLVGSKKIDLSIQFYELSNGNYVIAAPYWDNDTAIDAGAVIFGKPNIALTGIISSSNALVGNKSYDYIGGFNGGIAKLANDNFVVTSPSYDNGNKIDVGAVTWVDGNVGLTGFVNQSNSLIGGSNDDKIGSWGRGATVPLPNGNYVIVSPQYDNGFILDAGAVTWVDGTKGLRGVVNSSNSLVGSNLGDKIGDDRFLISSNSDYLVYSPNWDDGAIANAAAYTFCNGAKGLVGEINACNSMVINNPTVLHYNNVHKYSIVSKSNNNLVRIFYENGLSLGLNLDETNVDIKNNLPVTYFYNGCREILTLQGSGTTPIRSNVVAKVWVDPLQPDSFVKRHYEINPQTKTDSLTSFVTLYFSQAEFDDYNSIKKIKLPTHPTDILNKENLRIVNRKGASSNNSGMPSSYKGKYFEINPLDSNIRWNEFLQRWEVSFELKGYGGLFIISQKKTSHLNNMPTVGNASFFPNPAVDYAFLKLSNNQPLSIALTDITGKRVLEEFFPGEGLFKVNLENLNAGVYFVTLSTGEVFKLIKQ